MPQIQAQSPRYGGAGQFSLDGVGLIDAVSVFACDSEVFELEVIESGVGCGLGEFAHQVQFGGDECFRQCGVGGSGH